MYTIVLNTGQVYRNIDGAVVAPSESVNEFDYQEYITWINEGNQPLELYSPGEDYTFNGSEFILKFEVSKQKKLEELNELFTEQFHSGKFICSFGFVVDNRRYGDKNDKDNIQSLIDLGINIFKDADGNFHELSSEQLLQIKMEMTEDGLQKYQKKWYYEGLINSCTTTIELDTIIIQF